MATRGTIAVTLKNGKVRQVPSHWDNYISRNGRILQTHYNSLELAELVTSGGYISALAPKFEPDLDKPHTFNTPQEGVTILYARDRGENLVSNTFASEQDYFDNASYEDYNYWFKDGRWLVASADDIEYGGWKLLEQQLKKLAD